MVLVSFTTEKEQVNLEDISEEFTEPPSIEGLQRIIKNL